MSGTFDRTSGRFTPFCEEQTGRQDFLLVVLLWTLAIAMVSSCGSRSGEDKQASDGGPGGGPDHDAMASIGTVDAQKAPCDGRNSETCRSTPSDGCRAVVGYGGDAGGQFFECRDGRVFPNTVIACAISDVSGQCWLFTDSFTPSGWTVVPCSAANGCPVRP